MKYHYKSPEQLKEDLHTRAEPARKAPNRGRMIFIIDIAILLLIFGILYYKGVLVRTDTSAPRVTLEQVTFSGSLPGIKRHGKHVDVFVNVSNQRTAPLDLKKVKGPWELVSARAEFHSAGVLVHETIGTVIGPGMQVPPGGDRQLQFRLSLPDPVRDRVETLELVLRLRFNARADGRPRAITLRFPEVALK